MIGEVTPERIAVVRQATAIEEGELKDTPAFQGMAILHEDRVTVNLMGSMRFERMTSAV